VPLPPRPSPAGGTSLKTAGVAMPRRRFLFLLASVSVSAWYRRPAAAADAPVVAAASDLEFALTELAEAFTRRTGQRVRLSFGSSGNFRRLIAQGGPYEIFLSADEDYVLALHKDGLTVDAGVLYASGRIVLFAAHDSPLEVDPELRGLRAALAEARIERFAIANPEHAPYGRRAREALEHAGLWEPIQDHLVLGENVAQAAQFAASGAAQGGIVAHSLAAAPRLGERGRFALIPEDWHRPLRQRMVLLRRAGATARAFYDYLQGAEARAILTRYGFALPDDAA